MNTQQVKIGDKITAPANYRGQPVPAIEWTVYKENSKSFGVFGTLNAGKPDWQQFNLLLSKKTGKISA